MGEREALLTAVAVAWDDPLPVLVTADWLEDNGWGDPAFLRWYATQVMPALARVPLAAPRVPDSVLSRARRALLPHPRAESLELLAAVACCRRPEVWDGLSSPLTREAVAVTRLFALGLVTPAERRAAHRKLITELHRLEPRSREAERAASRWQTHSGRRRTRGTLGELSRLQAELQTVSHIAEAGAFGAAGRLLARAGREAGLPGGHFRGYQAAVCLVLATVPPFPPPETVADPPGKSRRPRRSAHDDPPYRRFWPTFEGRRYDCEVVCVRPAEPDRPMEWAFCPHYITVRAGDGQRLLAWFGYTVWHFVGSHHQFPGRTLVGRLVADGLAAGWRPDIPGQPDFALDGGGYLPPADETTFG